MTIKRTKEYPPHIQIMLKVFDAAESYRLENNALRSILRKQGLSDVAIQSRVKRLLKKPGEHEPAAQLLKRVCEESLKHFDETYLATFLSGVTIKGKVQ